MEEGGRRTRRRECKEDNEEEEGGGGRRREGEVIVSCSFQCAAAKRRRVPRTGPPSRYMGGGDAARGPTLCLRHVYSLYDCSCTLQWFLCFDCCFVSLRWRADEKGPEDWPTLPVHGGWCCRSGIQIMIASNNDCFAYLTVCLLVLLHLSDV